MKDIFICSKMAGDNAYTTWKKKGKGGNDLPRKERQVLIHGGTGVINKALVTPFGVVTKITADQLALLKESCKPFNRHVEAGFLKILEKDPTPKAIKSMASDMATDKSEQKKPSDFKKKKDKK